jgi:hypothetical protein
VFVGASEPGRKSVKTIPICIARTRIGDVTMSVYRTAEGRLAFESAEGAGLELYDSVDDLAERIPDELAVLVRANADGPRAAPSTERNPGEGGVTAAPAS